MKVSKLAELKEEVELLKEKLETLEAIQEIQVALDELEKSKFPTVYPYYPPYYHDDTSSQPWPYPWTWTTSESNSTGEPYASFSKKVKIGPV